MFRVIHAVASMMIGGLSSQPTARTTPKPTKPIQWLTGLTDIITLDDEGLTAKMPCGHSLGSESMAAYCQDQLDKQRYRIVCPECGQEWIYPNVRDVARLQLPKRQKVEKQLAGNYMSMREKFRQCPRCTTWCSRKDPSKLGVRCVHCVNGPGNPDFCWNCTQPWVSDGGKSCHNSRCVAEEDKLKILRECGTKQISGRKCPSKRACPDCTTLIEHEEACKSMVCQGCGGEFCFWCLAYDPVATKGTRFWNHSSCHVAPIQTTCRKQ